MDSDNTEYRALAAKLIAVLCVPLNNFIRTYEVFGYNDDVFFPWLRAYHGNEIFRHIWIPLLSKARQVRIQNLPEDEHETKLIEAFVEVCCNFKKKNPDHTVTDEDLYWLADATHRLGIGNLIWPSLRNSRLHSDYEGFKKDTIEFVKITNSSTEEFAALLLDAYGDFKDLRLPPGHPVWKSLGVNDLGEYRNRGLAQAFKEAQWAKTGKLNEYAKQLIKTARNEFTHRGWSERAYYAGEHIEEVPEEDTVKFHISDEKRLFSFCELSGIDANTLSDSDSKRILELLRAFDEGFDFASKKGVSMKAYYGNRADSEKTQRQRLFKKLRSARNAEK
jgi:hypothetical protein